MWSRSIVIALAAAVFITCSVLPFAYLLARVTNFTALWLDARQLGLLYNTLILGTVTSFFATFVGAPLGVSLARVDLPWKNLMRVLLSAPMLLPPYVVGLAWVTAGRNLPSSWTYSVGGAVLVLTVVFYPFSMLATEAAVRRIEPRLEEAALLVARPGRVFRSITLRLAAPSILAAALLIFVLAASEFGVPGLLRVRVFTTEVFTAFAALYDFARATVLALPLLILSTAVTALALLVLGERMLVTRRGAAGEYSYLVAPGKPAVAALFVVTVALVLPLFVLIREASAVRSWPSVLAGSGAAIGRSLALSVVGATLVTLFALPLGYASARAPRALGAFADLAFLSLFAAPGTVIGVGLIGLWNRPGAFGAIYGTDAMLLLVCAARFLPVAALGLAAAARQLPLSHEEAAAAAGARWPRTMMHIVVPQMRTGLIAVWVAVFVLAFGELGASILVAPPGEATLPIRMYTLVANAPPGDLAALALLQSAVVLLPLALLARGIAGREAT